MIVVLLIKERVTNILYTGILNFCIIMWTLLHYKETFHPTLKNLFTRRGLVEHRTNVNVSFCIVGALTSIQYVFDVVVLYPTKVPLDII